MGFIISRLMVSVIVLMMALNVNGTLISTKIFVEYYPPAGPPNSPLILEAPAEIELKDGYQIRTTVMIQHALDTGSDKVGLDHVVKGLQVISDN